MNYNKIFKLAQELNTKIPDKIQETPTSTMQNLSGTEKKNWDESKKYIENKMQGFQTQARILANDKNATYQQFADMANNVINLINSTHSNSSQILGFIGYLFSKAVIRTTGKMRSDYINLSRKYLQDALNSTDRLSSAKNIQIYLNILKGLDNYNLANL
jgi:hypothetical protein